MTTARQWQPHALEPNRDRERPVAIVAQEMMESVKQMVPSDVYVSTYPLIALNV